MATRTRADVQKFIHANFNAAVTPATKNAGTRAGGDPYLINFLYIENMSETIKIYVSFDAGTTWKTIREGTYLSIGADSLVSYQIKSDSGTPAVECLYGVEN